MEEFPYREWLQTWNKPIGYDLCVKPDGHNSDALMEEFALFYEESKTKSLYFKPLPSYEIFYIDISEDTDLDNKFDFMDKQIHKLIDMKSEYLFYLSYGAEPKIAKNSAELKELLDKMEKIDKIRT